MKKQFLFLFLFLFLFVTLVSALDLPVGLQKVIEYNQQQAGYYFETISYFMAFLGGVLALLSPCTLAIIPLYFSYGLKERSTLHTFSFFLGFTLIFVALGLAASAVGQSIISFQQSHAFYISLIGIFLILFGIFQILGKGFSLLPLKVFHAKNLFSVFLLGMLFAFGWTACTGPILGGVLLVASVLGSYMKVALLMFFYALGNFVPFFLLSFAIDGFHLNEVSWIKGKLLSFTLFGEKFETHTTQIFSGALLVFMGLLFLFFQGTGLFNQILIGGLNITGDDLQRSLLSSPFVSALGGVLLMVFLLCLLYFLVRHRKR